MTRSHPTAEQKVQALMDLENPILSLGHMLHIVLQGVDSLDARPDGEDYVTCRLTRESFEALLFAAGDCYGRGQTIKSEFYAAISGRAA